MLTLRLGDAAPPGSPFAGAIGNFDGVHIGHGYLLRQLLDSAHRQGLGSLAITFWPNPRAVLQPASWDGYLTSFDERERLLAAAGLDAALVLPFTRDFSALTPDAFVQSLADAVPLRELWVGEDFRFGRQRSGDVAALRALAGSHGIAMRTVARQAQGQEVVGSSAIRSLLRAGQVEEAMGLLGRAFALTGVVVAVDRRGRQLGYPTANLAPDEGKVIPARGIYAALAEAGDLVRPAAVSIGIRPQFGGGAELIEAYLLDFDGDLYGQRLTLHFRARLRDEQRFASVDALREQMARDVAAARDLLSRPPNGTTPAEDPPRGVDVRQGSEFSHRT